MSRRAYLFRLRLPRPIERRTDLVVAFTLVIPIAGMRLVQLLKKS